MLPSHSTNLFSSPQYGTMVTEVSTLGSIADLCAGHVFGRVYPDACDEGFGLVSHRTGHTMYFAVDRVERDREGDIVAWHLVPTAQSKRAHPRAAGLKVTVYND